ncbi:MAG: ERCC4 domain-containing protein, partial [Halobacteriaceae archaeon]
DEFNKETRFAPKSNVEEPTTDSKIDTPSVDGAGDTTEIVIDQRELDSSIARTLSQADSVSTRLETLEVADYILSDRVAVERKTVADFVDSLISGDDRSLFDQIGDLSRNYHRPVLIIEGEELYSERNVHPNAIQGTLSSIIADFGVSILQTADMDETADLLQTIAQREQEETNREISVHGEKASKTLAEQQEYVISSIADVGPVTARSLLEEFGSVETVLTADKDELTTVEGVGEITASRIREVVGSEYVPD